MNAVLFMSSSNCTILITGGFMKSLLLFIVLIVGFAFAEGTSSDESQTNESYTEAQALIEAEDYQGAIDLLLPLAAADDQNADVFNLLGYSHRKIELYEEALEYYLTALELDPAHLGANEYLGELYLETDQPDKAAEQVAMLETLCPEGCEELTELQEALVAYQP
jgi:tetratricopeptide (TPR) repeat protein